TVPGANECGSSASRYSHGWPAWTLRSSGFRKRTCTRSARRRSMPSPCLRAATGAGKSLLRSCRCPLCATPRPMPTLSVPSVLIFGALVVFFLWLDLHAHRGAQTIGVRNALGWSLVWFALALGFAAFLGLYFGMEKAFLFLTGYVLEQSLSVD